MTNFFESPEEFNEFKNGSTLAFKFLFYKYHSGVYRFILKLSGDVDITQHVVTEALYTGWLRRDHIEDEKHFIAYVYITAKCIFLSLLRRNKTRKKVEQQWASSQDNSQDDPEEKERLKDNAVAMLRMAMKKLPRQRGTIIYKLYFEGKTVRQAATEMELAEQTVRNQHGKAKAFLKKELAGIEFVFVLIGILLWRYGF